MAAKKGGRPKSEFQRWYADPKNRETLNKRRRKRYKEDKKYRAKQLASTRRWRRSNPDKVARPTEKRATLFIGEVAEQVGCDVQTIRSMEERGLIPEPTFGNIKRQYSPKQVKLIAGVRRVSEKFHYKDPRYKEAMDKAVQRAASEW